MRDIEKIIRALNSPIRREILSLVWERDLAAGEIAAAFEVTKPTISQHLSVLRDAGLVTIEVAGTSRRYQARREELAGLHAALGDPGKWSTADNLPERSLAEAHTSFVVIAAVDVEVDQAATFTAFTDATIYSRWLGVPVHIEDSRFSCTLEWGTTVQGRYEVAVPPELIVMRWDFDDGMIPVPGNERTGYLRVSPTEGGAHVEVHQLVETPTQAEFMEAAWSMVLGRLKAGIVNASRPDATVSTRPTRTKRRDSA